MTIIQQLAEADMWILELKAKASKLGRDQSIYQHRLAAAEAIRETLVRALNEGKGE